METCPRPYPGAEATAADVFRLAEEYRKAAGALLKLGRRGAPLTLSPFRLAALQAIELYLNAWLLLDGKTPAEIRSLQHDFAERTILVIGSGLALRRKTVAHCTALSARREYLISRYGPDQTHVLSQTNRLETTLNEIANKVGKRFPRSG